MKQHETFEWQNILKALRRVEDDHRNNAGQEHYHRAFRPTHLARFIHRGQLVDQSLKRPEHWIEKRPLTIEDVRHEEAQRLCHGVDQSHEKRICNQPLRAISELLRAQ